MTGDIILNNFNLQKSRFKIAIITIFDIENTDIDYRNKHFYARLYEIDGGDIRATHFVILGNSVAEIENKIPLGMVSVGRSYFDEKEIIKSYL